MKRIVALCSIRQFYPDHYVNIPITAKDVPIEQKRKKGRPGLAKKGLERQDNEARYATFQSVPDPDSDTEEPPTKKRKTTKTLLKS